MSTDISKRDSYFRSMLSYPDIAMEFVRLRLPQEFLEALKVINVEIYPSNTLKMSLNNSQMDVVLKLTGESYQVSYAIVEHQSRPARLMAARLWMYQTDVMREHLKSLPPFTKNVRICLPYLRVCTTQACVSPILIR